jgi:YfiH family protein
MQPEQIRQIDIDWPAPAGVGAIMSTRIGGVSCGRFKGFNLGDHVGDAVGAVQQNRRAFEQLVGARACWLRQVHEANVVDAAASAGAEAPLADAAFASTPGVACAVLVADCLPVLLAANNGRAVAAAHAGWRGLAIGVVERAVESVSKAAGCEPKDLVAWLGPCIGPDRFEVGAEVMNAFGPLEAVRFVSGAARQGRARWMADLPGLARDRLRRMGVTSVSGGRWCTVSDAERFYSYRREGVTGRMAAAVWLRGA